MPFVYYKGYQVFSQSGLSYDTELDYDTGMLRIIIPSDMTGYDTITAKYAETKYQKLAYLITLCSSLCSGLFWAIKRLKKRKYA